MTCGTGLPGCRGLAGRPAPLAPILAELARRGETVGAEPADYVVVDAQAPGAIAWARSLGVPAIAVHTGLASIENRLDLNLVLLSRVLQPEAGRFDESYRFVGRCLDDSIEEPPFPWHELGVDPLIYFSAGVPSAGVETGAFDGLPFHVMVDGAGLPRRQLLERATLAIHDAEAGMVEDCAHAGVPQLLYAREGDAFRLAGRVQELGAGLLMGDADLEPGQLRRLAGHAMADPRYTRAAMALSETARRSGGTAQACEEILAFVRRGRTEPPEALC